MTSLQKQNFNLKLELYHRRERQTALEGRVENLEMEKGDMETEKRELEDINDSLLAEVEKRDKAVGEAVAMIVSLESQIKQLLEERDMVRQVDADSFAYSGGQARFPPNNTSAAKLSSLHTRAQDDAKSLARVPSFLSDRSETTENLRSVYLGAPASLLSLPRMSEDAVDADGRLASNMMASPSMSVLSESSFLSIYGQKTHRAGSTSPPPLPREASYQDGAAAVTVAEKLAPKKRSASRSSPSRKASSSSSSRGRRSGSLTRGNTANTFSSITELMDMHYSPLQRLEKMEKSLAAMNESSRPGSQEAEADAEQLSRHVRTQLQAKTKQEKREALRKVRTDTPFSRDLLNQHNLPPTPDTISTSTLRRFKNSNDTLSREKDGNDRSFLAPSEATTSQSSGVERAGSGGAAGANPFSQPPSITAFHSRRDRSAGSSYFDNRLPVPARPRSADETTVSGHGRAPLAWESDSSEELDGNDSASLHDYWMRESLRPTTTGNLNPADRRLAAAAAAKSSYGRPGRTSPDLFSFPTTTRGWATDTMFGTLGGAGYLGAGGGAPLSHTLDALGESLPTPQAGFFGSGLASPGPAGDVLPPPPPNRRSSLHARTGTSSASTSSGPPPPGTPAATPPTHGRLRKSPTRARSRSNSTDARPRSSSGQPSTVAPPPPAAAEPAATAKSRRYPPAAGAPNPPKARMLSLFRRSGSHEAPPPGPASAPPTETTFAAALSKSTTMPMVGIPSWGKRTDLVVDDDRDSATPPPILRNPRAGVSRGGVEMAPAADSRAAAQPGSPLKEPYVPFAGEDPTGDAAGAGGAGRRRWLGLGRVASLRNRAG